MYYDECVSDFSEWVASELTRRALVAYRRWWMRCFAASPEPEDPLWINPHNKRQLAQEAIASMLRRPRRPWQRWAIPSVD